MTLIFSCDFIWKGDYFELDFNLLEEPCFIEKVFNSAGLLIRLNDFSIIIVVSLRLLFEMLEMFCEFYNLDELLELDFLLLISSYLMLKYRLF
jgi:hypothetical protein